MIYFADTLNEILQDKEMSKLSLSKEIGIPMNTLYNMKIYCPTVYTALKIVDYFSSSLDYFERKIDMFEC